MKFEDMINTIQLGDSYELIKEIPDKSIDLVITDPPYLIETDGAGMFNKNKKDGSKWYVKGERYVMQNIDSMKNGFTNELLDELCRVMKKINIYIWCSQKQIPQLLNYFVEEKHCNWNILCWHKTNPLPTCNNKYLPDTEYLMFFREKGVKIYGTMKTKFTYYVSRLNTKDKKIYKHPPIKPLNIIENLIINSSESGGGSFRYRCWKWNNLCSS